MVNLAGCTKNGSDSPFIHIIHTPSRAIVEKLCTIHAAGFRRKRTYTPIYPHYPHFFSVSLPDFSAGILPACFCTDLINFIISTKNTRLSLDKFALPAFVQKHIFTKII